MIMTMIIVILAVKHSRHSHRPCRTTSRIMPCAQYVPYQIPIPYRIVYAEHVIQFDATMKWATGNSQVTVVVSAC